MVIEWSGMFTSLCIAVMSRISFLAMINWAMYTARTNFWLLVCDKAVVMRQMYAVQQVHPLI